MCLEAICPRHILTIAFQHLMIVILHCKYPYTTICLDYADEDNFTYKASLYEDQEHAFIVQKAVLHTERFALNQAFRYLEHLLNQTLDQQQLHDDPERTLKLYRSLLSIEVNTASLISEVNALVLQQCPELLDE